MSTALVLGASGYVGSRLLPRLLSEGYSVRILTRSLERVADRDWVGQVEVIEADASSVAALDQAMTGVDVVFYLLHSMGGDGDFAERDRRLAGRVGTAAQSAGVRRIVYLSGLHPSGALSAHLASRVEVGELLMKSGVATSVLQAAVVVGAGSASFEMLRHLTEHLPAMVTPKWLNNRIQPIAIADVLDHLVFAATLPADQNRTFDIGGPQVLTYREMIERYAALAGLSRRRIITVPVLTPHLASHWIGLVTPVPTGVAKPLVGSLVHEVVTHEQDLTQLMGREQADLIGFDDAVRAALAGADDEAAPEPGHTDPARLTRADPDWAGKSSLAASLPLLRRLSARTSSARPLVRS